MPLLGQTDPRFRVRYADGEISALMDKSTASSYAGMFDGEVEEAVLLTGREKFGRAAVNVLGPVLFITVMIMIAGLMFVVLLK